MYVLVAHLNGFTAINGKLKCIGLKDSILAIQLKGLRADDSRYDVFIQAKIKHRAISPYANEFNEQLYPMFTNTKVLSLT